MAKSLKGHLGESLQKKSVKREEQMKKVQDYFLYFMLYSVIGWIYEVFLEVVVYRWGFSNRGALFGPYCVVYGFGAVILLLTLSGLMKKKLRLGPVPVTPVFVFLGIVLITTELSGTDCSESQYPLRNRRYGDSLPAAPAGGAAHGRDKPPDSEGGSSYLPDCSGCRLSAPGFKKLDLTPAWELSEPIRTH